MADRFTYIPAIGLLVIIAWGWESLSFRIPYRQIITAALAFAVLMNFTWLSRKQLSYWQNPRILFEHTLSVTRENPIALFGYANGLEREGLIDEAIEKYYQALSLRHDYEPAHTNLGNIFSNKKQFEKAVYHYTLAMRMTPDSVKARLNLAKSYAAWGKFEDALTHYEKALAIEPDNPLLHYNIGVAHYKLYQYDKAIDHFQTAIRLQPDYDRAQKALKMVQDIKG
jgi:tetratricopeptide (TPR) repeat protein